MRCTMWKLQWNVSYLNSHAQAWYKHLLHVPGNSSTKLEQKSSTVPLFVNLDISWQKLNHLFCQSWYHEIALHHPMALLLTLQNSMIKFRSCPIFLNFSSSAFVSISWIYNICSSCTLYRQTSSLGILVCIFTLS